MLEKVPYLIIYVKCTSIQETGLEKRLLLPKENTIIKIAVMSFCRFAGHLFFIRTFCRRGSR